jgi:CheY-like chemotaxis protein
MQILWIDDEPSRYEILMREINNWKNCPPIDIVFAHGFEQINHYLKYHTWDVILLDADMPLMCGTEVAKEFLRERNIPVIVISTNPVKVQHILDTLNEYETPCVAASITTPSAIVNILRSINASLS